MPKSVTPASVLVGESPFVLTATLEPVANQDRFQPAGFPEVGHVIYKAPRQNGAVENVCIVDSPASMANHLESVCMRGAHDLDLVEDLNGMPHVRCVTDAGWPEVDSSKPKETVVTSLTEGHRIASTYFLGGKRLLNDGAGDETFGDVLAGEMGVLNLGKRAHPPALKWWQVFKTMYKYDPNALVHGVLFPQWQIKISRALTAHMEAFGAGRVDRSGVKFDRLGKTTSGQPIFAVDDATAQEIRATFIIDVALIRSFGREDDKKLGLTEKQKEFLVGLALWKIQRLIESPFRFRSGCQLQQKESSGQVAIDVNIKEVIQQAAFRDDNDNTPIITDIYWPANELYREAAEPSAASDAQQTNDDEQSAAKDENE